MEFYKWKGWMGIFWCSFKIYCKFWKILRLNFKWWYYRTDLIVLIKARHGTLLYNKNDIYIGKSIEKYGEFSYLEAKNIWTNL